jgi:hypothetical protein
VTTAGADPGALRSVLEQQQEGDRHLLALVYGYGLDLGLAAWTLDLDPALAHWRLRAALASAGSNGSQGSRRGDGRGDTVEHALAALLRAGSGPSDEACRLLEELPRPAQVRLAAALDGSRAAAAASEGARPGLGVGSLVVVVSAIAAFLLYGVIRDTNPLRYGQTLVRLGDYPKARIALEEMGTLPEARVWIAITWLAEGEYERALEALQSPGASAFLAAFRPIDEPLTSIDGDRHSGALLPRGLIIAARPTLVYRSGPAGEILLAGQPLDGQPIELRPVRLAVGDTRAGGPVAALPWPGTLGKLPPGSYAWSAPGDESAPVSFTLLPADQSATIETHARERLHYEIPYEAGAFLRAHYYLRHDLYTQAGQIFAGLHQRFPAQTYPLEMVEQIAAALGVDPSAFLR